MLPWTLPVVGLQKPQIFKDALEKKAKSQNETKTNKQKKKKKQPPKTPKQNTELIPFKLRFTMFFISF